MAECCSLSSSGRTRRDVQTRLLVVFRSCNGVMLRLGGGLFRAAAGVTTAVVAPCGTGVRASFAKRSRRVNAMPRCCCCSICRPCSHRLDRSQILDGTVDGHGSKALFCPDAMSSSELDPTARTTSNTGRNSCSVRD